MSQEDEKRARIIADQATRQAARERDAPKPPPKRRSNWAASPPVAPSKRASWKQAKGTAPAPRAPKDDTET